MLLAGSAGHFFFNVYDESKKLCLVMLPLSSRFHALLLSAKIASCLKIAYRQGACSDISSRHTGV